MADRLPMDVWSRIGHKLDSTGDRIRFRAVSKSWRSALPFRQPPLLMLSDLGGGGNTNTPARAGGGGLGVFVSLGDQTMYGIDFPDIRGGARVVACAGNWLITIQRCHQTILLSNPFSKLHFQLPLNELPAKQFRLNNLSPRSFMYGFITKLVLSSDSETDCVALSTDMYRLAIARPGDASWTTFAHCPNLNYEDVVFYQQQFYLIDTRGHLAVCNITGDSPQLKFLLYCYIENISDGRKHYLVEWAGELLLVVRFLDKVSSDPNRFTTYTFRIYKFDLANMRFHEFECLGDHSLFLGFSTSTSVLASNYFGLVRRNCIYFTDDTFSFGITITSVGTTENDIGVFDLEDHTVTPLFKGASTVYFRARSVWIIPA